MAPPQNPVHIIRPLSVYVNGDKQANITSGSYKINSNDEAQITDGGYSGHSDGSIMVSVDVKTLVGVTTSGYRMVANAMLNKSYVTVAIPIEGTIHQAVGRFKELGADWDHKNGTSMGNVTFEGGVPRVT
jgi:hypothetical protein